MKGLIVKSPWIELILEGKKTWEIRGSNTKIRGPIALIKSGSGMIYGEVNVNNSRELTLKDYQVSNEFHRVQSENFQALPYKKRMLGFLKIPKFMKNSFHISILWGQLSGSTFPSEFLLCCSGIGGDS